MRLDSDEKPLDLIAQAVRRALGLDKESPPSVFNAQPAPQPQFVLNDDEIILTQIANAFAERIENALSPLIKRQVNFQYVPFFTNVAQAAPIVIRPQEERKYLLIQNLHAVNGLLVGFGYDPNLGNSMQIGAGGVYEPAWVPQNDLRINSTNPGMLGIVIYAGKND